MMTTRRAIQITGVVLIVPFALILLGLEIADLVHTFRAWHSTSILDSVSHLLMFPVWVVLTLGISVIPCRSLIRDLRRPISMLMPERRSKYRYWGQPLPRPARARKTMPRDEAVAVSLRLSESDTV